MGAKLGSFGHLFEAVAMKRDGSSVGCSESDRYQLSVLKTEGMDGCSMRAGGKKSSKMPFPY